jgi:hypothetical protein
MARVRASLLGLARERVRRYKMIFMVFVYRAAIVAFATFLSATAGFSL